MEISPSPEWSPSLLPRVLIEEAEFMHPARSMFLLKKVSPPRVTRWLGEKPLYTLNL